MIQSEGFYLMSKDLKLTPLIISVIIGLVLWFMPLPGGLSAQGQHLMAIFVATIVAVIGKALPMGAVMIISLLLTILTKTLSFGAAFSGFGEEVVWLIALAFFIARGFTKTGLGNRIAYLFVSILGKRTLGLGYGLVASELIIAPAIPSLTARAGGIIYPILQSLCRSYDSVPEKKSSRKISAFLTTVCFQGSAITSGMFLTAMAANPLIAAIAADKGISISWGQWALAAIVPGLLSLICIPLLLYKLYPPEIKETPNATSMAREKLAEMGKIKRDEWIMIGTFILLLVLWIFGSSFGVSATTAALLGLGILLFTGVLHWKDVTHEHGAWDILIWFATLVAIANSLNRFGVIDWVGSGIGGVIAGFEWPAALLILSLFYFYSHYLFAGNTTHISSMYGIFLVLALATGAPPLITALLLGFFSNLFGGLTHYASGPAAIFYEAGHVPLGTWWGLGAICSVVNIIIWMGIGGLWWKFLGLI
jgi:DASS family divalent anion:Na+ symporter